MKKIVPIFCIVMLISFMICSFKMVGGKYIGEIMANSLGVGFSKIFVAGGVFLFLYLSNRTTKEKYPGLEKFYKKIFPVLVVIAIATFVIFR